MSTKPVFSRLSSPLLAGAAWTDITPDLPVRRGGGGVGGMQARYTEEVVSPLTAQSVAWGDGPCGVIWTSCDLGEVGQELVCEFRNSVSQKTGLPPHQINISATHNHGAPDSPKFSLYHSESSLAETRETHRIMIQKAALSAVDAYRSRIPVRVGYGCGRVERACFNRRFIMSNGRSRTHGTARDGVERLQVEGPVDDTLQVVWFENSESGHPVAILVNLASHPNQMYGLPALGSDYPGVMRDTVCRALGRKFPIVFLQGACGNVQTVDIAGEPGWGLRRKGIQTIGNLLAGEVLKLLHSSTPRETIGLTLGLGRASAELSLRVFPPEEVAHTLRIVEEAARSGHLKAFLDARFPSIEEKARAQQIVSIASLQKGGTREVVEIGGLRLGEVLFLTTPAHQFVEFQIALKQALPGTKVLLADFTNGFVNYVPTPLAIALGGYEPEHRRYEASAGEKILSVSITLAKNLLEDSLTIESS